MGGIIWQDKYPTVVGLLHAGFDFGWLGAALASKSPAVKESQAV